MATMTKLYEMVLADDYEGLEDLLHSGKELPWGSIKSRFSLLYKAIEYRSLKTFDLLISIPNLSLLKNDSGNINGMGIAIEYYMNAPNERNEYYIKRLLEKNVKITSGLFYRCGTNRYLFELLFDKFEKTEADITTIMNVVTSAGDLYLIKYIFNYMETNNVPFFYTPQTKARFSSKTLEYLISYCLIRKTDIEDGIKIIEYMIQYGADWKKINNEPSLYNVFPNKALFNYYLDKYKLLTKEEFNSIPNINNITFDLLYSVKGDYCYRIFELPFIKIDSTVIVTEYFEHFVKNFYGRVSKQITNEFLYYVLKKYPIQEFPYEIVTSKLNTINARLTNQNTYYYQYNATANRELIYICEHFGFNIRQNTWKGIFPENQDYTTAKTALLASLEKNYITVTTPKKTIKKKVVKNNDIEV